MQILLVLADTNLHGYGLMKAVQDESGGRVALEVGSLYRVINRMLETELIERLPAAGGDDDARRKHDYAITDFGRATVRLESERLTQVLATARSRNLAGQA
jgi:DNA-binding PadR family transcriptional regulator